MCVWGGGGVGPPTFRPLIEVELRGKIEPVASDGTKPTISSFKTLRQLLTHDVRSTTSESHMFFC